MANCHPGRDSMGVDNHVRNNSIACERQILLPVSYSACSLLSVSTGKLVTDLRNLNRSHLDFDIPHVFFVGSHAHCVNDSFFRMFQSS